MVYGRYIYNIHEVYKPTYTWGAPPCSNNGIMSSLYQKEYGVYSGYITIDPISGL